MKIKRMQEKAREKEEKAKDAEFAKEIKKQFRKGHRPPKPKTYTPETKEWGSASKKPGAPACPTGSTWPGKSARDKK